MKKDIKVTILPTFYNDDNELQEEAFGHFFNGVTIYVDPDDLDIFPYDEALDDDTIEAINALVEAEYENEEYPATEVRVTVEPR